MFQIAGKDLKLFFADKRGMLLTFAVPIALITLFAFAFGGAGQSFASSVATANTLTVELGQTAAIGDSIVWIVGKL
jgi:ABC-type transport system involved in cytochrome c biogenesis permease component